MICSRCLKRSTFSRLQSQSRAFTSTPLLSSTPPTSTPSSPRTAGPPTATSTGVAQPFSTPLSPSPAALGISSQPAKKTASLPTSSVPAGTILRGLNFLKGRDDPVALKEEEYPEWLWHCLDVKKTVDGAEATGGDEFSKSKKLRRQAAKARRKAEERALLSGDTSMLEVKVPLQQQSIDLPTEGKEALEQRADLRKAMRKERRAKIKEGNYLKGMFDTRIDTYKGGSWSHEDKPSRKRETCITFVYMHIVRILETKFVLYDSLKTPIMLSTCMGIIEQRRQLHGSPWNFPSLRMHQ
ncbi:hypothetical protein EYC80_008145 [Monilinia laxa]|uniref:Large ribosomal subunit protein mL54 n=1 Tax=Monilinia laxa TaxID=61186 RepID=A0A5N6JV58_MONLA|nr:hypothetical protein EYC80_008145 [Monilinia laxa]